METVYIVSAGVKGRRIIQGIFRDKPLADTFAKLFPYPLIEEEIMYTEFPKVYRYECTVELATGSIIKIEPCTPCVNPVLLTLDGKILYAVGETKAEAQYNAEAYHKRLSTSLND